MSLKSYKNIPTVAYYTKITYFAPGLCGSSLKVAKFDALSGDMRTEMAATYQLDNFNINRAK